MTMRVKLITIFLLTFILFVGGLVWRVDHLLFADNNAKMEASNRQQISAIVDAMDFEMQNLNNILALSFSEIERSSSDYLSGAPYSRFQMLASLSPAASDNAAGDWQMGTPHFLEKSDVRSWGASYVALALKSIKPANFQLGASQVFAINDPKRNPYMLFVSRGIRQWYVGVLKTDVFQKLMDRQKGQLNSVFVVNAQGQALGHTTAEYVGKMLSEDPLVAEIIKSSLPSGAGSFNNLKQEPIYGIYEKIPMSNLYVVVTTPLQPILDQRSDSRWQFVFMGLGLCLIGLAAFIFLVKNEESKELDLAPPVAMSAAPAAQAIPNPKKIDTEKMSSYVKLASSLSQELKQPLTSVLGSLQLALNLVSDQKAIDHINRATKETRLARDLVQKLVLFSGEDKLTLTEANLETLVNKALKNLDSRFSIKGIKLSKNIQAVKPFMMPADMVIRAIEGILMNAVEAMERAPQKNLAVELEQKNLDTVLTISDSGEGMDSELLNKAFDPFFTTRAQGQHVGLGLSMARGIIKESNGNIHIESEKGKGTKVIMIFNPLSNSLASAEMPVAEAPEAQTRSSISIDIEQTVVDPLPSSNPLLVDNTIDHLIDGAEPEEIDLLQSKKVSTEIEDQLPPVPSPDQIQTDEKTSVISISEEAPASNIDRPQLEIKKKISKLDESPIAIRRPGEKS